MENNIEVGTFFPTPIYTVIKPEFLDITKSVVDDYVNKIRSTQKRSELNPVYQTEPMQGDSRLREFNQFVLDTAWNILVNQGYKMDDKSTYFESMWGQQYYKTGGMDSHLHNNGVQIVGFYFIECPKDSSRIVIHDPRSGKKQISLQEQDVSTISMASDMVNFDPKEGTMMFMNSWLPHSLNRHGSEKPFKFIHFNIFVGPVFKPIVASGAEVI